MTDVKMRNKSDQKSPETYQKWVQKNITNKNSKKKFKSYLFGQDEDTMK